MNERNYESTRSTDELLEQQVDRPSQALMTAITKAELDQQITTARAFPRSVKRFINNCMDLATLNEAVAFSCLYALPRGKKTIEGASARFAEMLQSSWGNCRAGARVVDVGDEFVTAQGVFHDLESNSMTTMEVRRRITDSEGRRYNEDMIVMTGNAAASIAHRNAVLKGVPKALWNPIYLAAKKTAVGDIKSLANTRAEAFAWLQHRHVSEAMALASLGVEGIEDVGLDELATLRGAIAAVQNGELTIETAFAARDIKAPSGKPKTAEPKAKTANKDAGKDAGKAADKTTKKSGAESGKTPATAADALADNQKALRNEIDKSGVPENEVLAKFEKGTIEEFSLEECIRAITWLKQVMSANG